MKFWLGAFGASGLIIFGMWGILTAIAVADGVPLFGPMKH